MKIAITITPNKMNCTDPWSISRASAASIVVPS
jgi:hypothetical protein